MASYIKNDVLLEEIIRCKSTGVLSKELLEMLSMMTREIMRKMRYKHSEDKEDCYMEAQMAIVRYWNNFDPNRSSNPFSFFTSVIKTAMARGWNELHPIKESQKVSIDEEGGVFNF